MRNLITNLRISLTLMFILATLLCGIYPLVVWAVAQTVFPREANGSLIIKNGKLIGSSLIAQNFVGDKYFHPRPSAAGAYGYDGAASGGSNLGPTSRKLIELVKERVRIYRTENELAHSVALPSDAVTASASGLDPHISLENALFQARRVARARGVTEREVVGKIQANTQPRDLMVFGEPRVNVLDLNLSLDAR